VREHLEKSGVMRDAVVQAGAKPARQQEVGKVGPGRGKKTLGDANRFDGTTNDYLAARLKRDAPDLAAEVKAGRKRIRDAAREAGSSRSPTRLQAALQVVTQGHARAARLS
jgi:hypothetical protein